MFHEPETNWRALAATGEKLVDLIINHRKANKLDKPIDRESVWLDLEHFTCNRLRGRKILWELCETKFKLPVKEHVVVSAVKAPTPAPAAFAPPATIAVESASVVDEPKPKAGCKTCGGRKKKQKGS